MAVPDTRIDRIAPRIPFFTPVLASGLNRCWSTNISIGGMGLTGLVAGDTTPQPGDDLEVTFVLGEGEQDMVAVGRVAWISRVRPDGHISLGVQFRELTSAARAELARFLAEHRPRVLLALASEEEQELATRTLPDVDLHCINSLHDLDVDLLRTCASIIVCAHDEENMTAFLEAMWKLRPETGVVPGELPLAPVTVCTHVDSDRLLPLFTTGKLYDVLRPPLERRALALAVERSCERWALQVEVRWASFQLEGVAVNKQRAKTPTQPELPHQSSNVVRASPEMQHVYELIRTVAVHDVPVLLTGETGTGKELAAREIHANSKRAKTPFVAQDCGTLTETLLESELFGHVKGAFTGATSDHPGLFQIADGGTIFLDEIQNTSAALQAKLLRVVEEGEVRPVGSARAKRVNVRLIAASNVDLKQAVKEQRFRADFYYRLNRFPIELPPLRDHIEDVLPLARHFVSILCEQMGRPVHRIDPRMERTLLGYRWPGNIRELRNAIERCVLLTPESEPLRWEMLPDDVRGSDATEAAQGLDAQLQDFERRLIQMALERNNGVIRRAAKDLDVNAITLSRKIKRLGLSARE